MKLINILIVGVISWLIIKFNPSHFSSLMKFAQSDFSASTSTKSITKPECIVKGNISYNGGKRLYHIPGMEDYQNTRIDSNKGERWFCSEEEAIANGWQKAPR